MRSALRASRRWITKLPLPQSRRRVLTTHLQRENTITTLKAEVETLKQKPADSTSTIVDDKTKGGEKNEAEEFADTVNEAIKLFNSI